MKIKSVRLKNYRQFDNAFFEFSDEFNIILGENGCGKTTITSAIQFCLYGAKHVINNKLLNQQFKGKEDLIKFGTSGSGDNNVFVEVEFVFGDEEPIFMNRTLEINSGDEQKSAYSIQNGMHKKESFARLIKRFPLFMSKIAIVDENNISIISDLINTGLENKTFINEVNKLSQNYQLEHYINVVSKALEIIDIKLINQENISKNTKKQVREATKNREKALEKRRECDRKIELLNKDIVTAEIKGKIVVIRKEIEELKTLVLKNNDHNVKYTNSKINELNSKYLNPILKNFYEESDLLENMIITNMQKSLSHLKISNDKITIDTSNISYPVEKLVNEKIPYDINVTTNINYEIDETLDSKLDSKMKELDEYMYLGQKNSNDKNTLKKTRDEAVTEFNRLDQIIKSVNSGIEKEIQISIRVQKKLRIALNLLQDLLDDNNDTLINNMQNNIDRNVKLILGQNSKVDIGQYYDIKYNKNGIDGTSGGINIAISIAYLLGLLESVAAIVTSFEEIIKVQNLTYPIILDGAFSKVDETNSGRITNLLKDSKSQIILFTYESDFNKIKNDIPQNMAIIKLGVK